MHILYHDKHAHWRFIGTTNVLAQHVKLTKIIHCKNYHTNKRGKKIPILKHNRPQRGADHCEHHCKSAKIFFWTAGFIQQCFFSISSQGG